MSKIALATGVVALIAVPLAMACAAAQSAAPYLAPGTAPPWAETTATTETKPAPTPAPTSPAAAATAPAAQLPQNAEPGASAPADATAQPPQGTEPSNTTSIPIAATPMQGMTTPRQAVSLRSGPNTSFPVIGTLRPGMPLRILATANYGWVQVETPAGSGWAYGSYLAPPAGDVPPVMPPGNAASPDFRSP